MQLIEIKDNIFDYARECADLCVICHIVNCQGKMGSGVALSLRIEYPEVYDEYAKICADAKRSKINLLGTTFVFPPFDDHGVTVCNMFAQDRYGHEKRHLDYEAFYKCLESIKEEFSHSLLTTQIKILFPKNIGCGNAGGNWEIVLTMIKEAFKDTELFIVIVEKELI